MSKNKTTSLKKQILTKIFFRISFQSYRNFKTIYFFFPILSLYVVDDINKNSIGNFFV